MQKIHLNRDRESLGQFTPEAVAEGLRSGRFRSTDLAWREGMDSWKPLSEWADLPTASAAPDFEFGDLPVSSSPLAAPELPATLPAWEAPGPQSTLGRIASTVKETLLSPAETFANLTSDKSLMRPFLFILFLGSITNCVAVAYQVIFAMVNPESLAELGTKLTQEQLVIGFIAAMILMPVIITIYSFVSSGLYHLGVMVTGGGKSFSTTFRVSCYVHGSTSVFQLIPMCGQYVQMIWGLVAMVIGLQKAHEISLFRAIVAVLLPMILLCGLVIGIVFLAFGAAFAAAGAGTQ